MGWKEVRHMDYHLMNEHRNKAIVQHNIMKIKAVSNVTTISLVMFLVAEVLFMLLLKKNVIQLDWLPYALIIGVNVIWHMLCKSVEKDKSPKAQRKLEHITNFYISAMLLAGAIVTLSNKVIFNNLMMYTLILLVCSSYFVLKKQQIMGPMIVASFIIVVGYFVSHGYSDAFILKALYIAILNPIAYVVSRSFYTSFVKATRAQAKLFKEMEERKIVMRKLRDANRQLEMQSKLDPLTQIFNRRAVNEHMSQLAIQATGNPFILSTIMLDIDYFKQYNDTYGHLAGDEVLIKVGGVLKELSEQYNVFVARWGGEEFMVVLYNADERKVQMICETIMNRIGYLNIEHKASLVSDKLTVSIGAHSVKVTNEKQIAESLDYADAALYDVKNSGRNGFTIRLSVV